MNTLITNLINNVFHVIWLCCIALEPKHSPKKNALISAACGAFFELLMLLIFYSNIGDSRAYFIAYPMAVFIFGGNFILFLSDSHPAKSLLLVSAYFCLWTFIYSVISAVTQTYAGAGNAVIWMLRIVLNLAFLLPFQFLLRPRLLRMYRNMKSDYGVISLLSFFMFFMLTVLQFYNQRKASLSVLYVFILMLIYLFMMIIYVVLFRFIMLSGYKAQVNEMQIHEKYLMEQIESYKEMEQNARQTRHDFRHHNLVIMEFVRNRDCEGAMKYLEEYEEKEEQKVRRSYCSNSAADCVLAAFVRKAEQNGIQVETDIRFWNAFQVSDFDLVSILANILENAVNGCVQVTGKREMKIVISQKGSKLIILCSNTCADGILFKKGLPKSRHREGVGVESILAVAEKYNGDVNFFAENGVFTCQVLLHTMA